MKRQYTDSSNADKAYQNMRCIVMKEHAINWDAVPDVITKDQLYRICHISKSTALYLLQSGKIPCEYELFRKKRTVAKKPPPE